MGAIKNRQTTEWGSFKRWSNQPPEFVNYIVTDEQCATTPNSPPPGGNFFKVESWKAKGSRINGGPDQYGEFTYRNSPSAALVGRTLPSILAPGDALSLGEAATKLIAGSNPNKPHVDVPAFIAELKDIPRLLKLEGDTIIRQVRNITKNAGKVNLAYQFGWAPLMGDLVKLLDFQKEVDRKVRILKKAKTDGRVSFNHQLYKGARTSEEYNNSLDLMVSQAYTLQMWGFITWFPASDLPQSDQEMVRLAARTVLGLNTSLWATAWELMPWSWLVDWCTNVGDFIQASRNSIPFQHSPCQIMIHMRRQALHPSKTFWGGGYHLSEGQFDHETKERYSVSGPVVEAKLPFLDDRQFSILASIGVNRRLGKILT